MHYSTFTGLAIAGIATVAKADFQIYVSRSRSYMRLEQAANGHRRPSTSSTSIRVSTTSPSCSVASRHAVTLEAPFLSATGMMRRVVVSAGRSLIPQSLWRTGMSRSWSSTSRTGVTSPFTVSCLTMLFAAPLTLCTEDRDYVLTPADGGDIAGTCVRDTGDDFTCTSNIQTETGSRVFICTSDLGGV